MNRSKFIVKLATQNKIAYASDDVEVANIDPGSSDCGDSDNGTISEPYQSSGSEFIISSHSSDLNSTNSETSHVIPVIKNFTFYQEDKQINDSIPVSKMETTIPEITTKSKVLKYLESLDESDQTELTNNKESELQEKTEKIHDSVGANPEQGRTETETEELEEQTVACHKIDYKQQYLKKPSARERPTICPICYTDVTTHFTRHLFRHHPDNEHVTKIKNLPPKGKERLALVSALRKQGYFHLKTEKNVLNPVRTSTKPETQYFVCVYCLGQYTKKLLYKHVKICKQKPASEKEPGKNCLTKSQNFLATITSKNQSFLRSDRIKNEVFSIMRADEISYAAKSDPLICMYGESLLNKHKRQQIATVISNKIREMGRLLIALRTINNSVDVLFDAMKPEIFADLISATKEISGYSPENKCFKSPSLALHMGTNLKIVCDIALKVVIEKKQLPNMKWENRDIKKQEIKDTKRLIQGHWCNEISSIALKVLKERQWEKPNTLPLTEDIQAFQTYVNNLSSQAYDEIQNNINLKTNYKILTECVLALTVMFNRKRVGDVQYLKITSYKKDQDTTNEKAFVESLTNVEKIISKKFKRVVTGGKGSKPIPILFTPQLQKYISTLLEIREQATVVPLSNPYLFANPGSSDKWMSGYHVIRKLALNCGAKNPSRLSSTRFRKHIATTLQLMAMDENDMEQVATFMGHTKKTHTEFYRLPQDIYQTAKVAKVLLLLEKGKGKQFKGKSLDEIEMDNDAYFSSDSDEDDTENVSQQFNTTNPETQPEVEDELDLGADNNIATGSGTKIAAKKPKKTDEIKEKKQSGRVRWSENEKKIVTEYFKNHIRKEITPKKHECDQLLAKHGDVFLHKDWVRIKTFVYNVFREK